MAIAMKEWKNRVETNVDFVKDSKATEMGSISLTNNIHSRVFGNQIPVINLDDEKEQDYEIGER